MVAFVSGHSGSGTDRLAASRQDSASFERRFLVRSRHSLRQGMRHGEGRAFEMAIPGIPLGGIHMFLPWKRRRKPAPVRRDYRPCLEALEDRTAPGIVNTTADSGVGSLRAAIMNAAAGESIPFEIEGAGVKTIKLLSPLPPITRQNTINGYSQPGSGANTQGPEDGDNAQLV